MASWKSSSSAYYEKAATAEGITGEVLLSTLERRLDSVVFRMGFAMTRREAVSW